MFHFTADFPLPVETEQHGQNSTNRGADFGDLRVLVVDDNATHRSILSEILQSWGVAAEAVTDATIALGALRQAAGRGMAFQLVLADAQMPGHDGFWLAEQISRDPSLGVTAS